MINTEKHDQQLNAVELQMINAGVTRGGCIPPIIWPPIVFPPICWPKPTPTFPDIDDIKSDSDSK